MRLLFLALAVLAPAGAAEISGRIQYSPETPLDQAQIALVNQATGIRQTAVSNSDGYYTISGAQPGVYKLIVRKDGFKTAVRMDIKLDVSELARIDFAMQLGAISEVITVVGEHEPLDAADASLRTVVRREFLDNLPVSGRALLTVLEMAGGVVMTPTGDSYGAGQFSVNGQRSDANYFTVDGVSANAGIAVPVALAALPPTVRQSPGGALPAYTSIGSLHSVVSLEALDEFRVDTATARADAGRMPGGQVALSTRSGTNQLHGTLFEYFRHDSMSANDWFANQSGQDRAPLRFNDFGGALGGPVIPNRTFFFASQETLGLGQSSAQLMTVPSAAVRQQAAPGIAPFLASLPDPVSVDPAIGAGSATDLVRRSAWVNAGSLRIDHAVNSRLQTFARFSHAPSSSRDTEFGGEQAVRLGISSDSVTAGADASISPRVQASIRFGYWNAVDEMSAAPVGAAAAADPGLAAAAGTPASQTAYWIYPSNIPTFANTDDRYSQRQWNLTGSIGAMRGAHQVRLGADYRAVVPEFRTQPYVAVPYYADLPSFLAARFLLLYVYQYQPARMRLANLSAYAEDAWKVSSALSISYGLRLESNPPPVSPDHPVFGAIAGNAVETSADGSALWRQGYVHAAPRFGVAWRPAGNSGLVLRSSAAMFYDTGFGSALKGSPFPASGRTIENTPFGPEQFTEVPMATRPPTQLLAADFRSPATVRWNAAVERTFAQGVVGSLSYVGALGSHLLRMQNTSQQHLIASDGWSRYHSMQAQVRAQAGGLLATFSLAWSHSIDNASTEDDPRAALASPPYVTFPVGVGNSDFDVRLSTFAAFVYRPARLRGWSVDGVLRARSGFPMNVYYGTTLILPNLVPRQATWIPDGSSAVGRSLNPAAFTAPPAGSQGNLGRDVLYGEGMWQFDLAAGREFALPRHVSVQLRAETFNALNHPNFGNPDGAVGALTFGRPAAMLNEFLGSGGPANGLTPALQIGGPRSVQVAVRVHF